MKKLKQVTGGNCFLLFLPWSLFSRSVNPWRRVSTYNTPHHINSETKRRGLITFCYSRPTPRHEKSLIFNLNNNNKNEPFPSSSPGDEPKAPTMTMYPGIRPKHPSLTICPWISPKQPSLTMYPGMSPKHPSLTMYPGVGHSVLLMSMFLFTWPVCSSCLGTKRVSWKGWVWLEHQYKIIYNS